MIRPQLVIAAEEGFLDLISERVVGEHVRVGGLGRFLIFSEPVSGGFCACSEALV